MSSKITVRGNILDYILQGADGGLTLVKAPVTWTKDGVAIIPPHICRPDGSYGGIDVRSVMAMINEKDTDYQFTSNEDIVKVCELILQREEANPGSVFSV
ncbi:hypothetical protein [Citrobacter phage Tr1]|nr:hypothetical protein [Citrobacter phage Tr1]